jgi:hypothetical protein
VAPATAPAGGPGADLAKRRPLEVIRCSYRPQDADFYCWKFGVWYNLMDCCYRHDQRTYEGCVDCGQGHSNLRQNRERYRIHRPRRGTAWGP